MSKMKPTPGGRGKKKAEVSLVRSSAAEYLTFVAASGQGGVEAVYADENVWLTQKMMGLLYNVETHTINYHLKKIFADSELQEDSVIRTFRITAADGKTYDTQNRDLAEDMALRQIPMTMQDWVRHPHPGPLPPGEGECLRQFFLASRAGGAGVVWRGGAVEAVAAGDPAADPGCFS
jgi:hypothetical protein